MISCTCASRLWTRFRRIALYIGLGSGALSITACGGSESGIVAAIIDDFLASFDRVGPDPGPPQYTAREFVNWESPHVSPLALAPSGELLAAVNTAAARVELLRIEDSGVVPVGSVPVGLDPVSARFRSDSELWVVNHVSDSVSVVDVASGRVVRTLLTADEPTDVVFAAGRALVVCSQANQVLAFDLANLDAAPASLPIWGEDPRAAALSPDGRTVAVAVFESGNNTTIVHRLSLKDPAGPLGGANPVPNTAGGYSPPERAGNPAGPPVGMIVKRDVENARWLDEMGVDWTAQAPWALTDYDVALIDTETLEIRYVPGLMNLNMQLGWRSDGTLAVVGTEAINQVRFEPNLRGKFVRSVLALLNPDESQAAQTVQIQDLNPQLVPLYSSANPVLPVEQRGDSVADPRAIVWSQDGGAGYVAGMGSDNVIAVGPTGERLGRVDVAAGPTGLALDASGQRLYVLSKFDLSVSVVDTATLAVEQVMPLADPTPMEIRAGRPLLYSARLTSGLGTTACAACHVDARSDHLAWDLGNPADVVAPFNLLCDDLNGTRSFFDPNCNDFHPLKGPMMTQSLQGVIGTEPLHWRGDRADLAAFKPAFVNLNGNDRTLSDDEMAALEGFIATITYPPNPHRLIDNQLPEELDGANPRRGRELYLTEPIDTLHGRLDDMPDLFQRAVDGLGGVLSCNRCHTLPLGTNLRFTSATDLDTDQGMKVPQLRGVYEKRGMAKESMTGIRGFGFAHDGSIATLPEFFSLQVFDFPGEEGQQKMRDIISFVFSMGVDTHAGVGQQVTLRAGDTATAARLDQLLSIARGGQVGLTAWAVVEGTQRGFYLDLASGQMVSAGLSMTPEALRALVAEDAEQTWTLTPLGSEQRLAQ